MSGHPIELSRFQPERALVEELFERFGLEVLVQHFVEDGGAAPVYDYLLSSQLRLTAVLAPRLRSLLDEVCALLEFTEPIDLFVAPSADVNAFALHSLCEGTPHAVSLTSALVERMDDDELRFVLGHEVGHLYHQHYRAALLPWHAYGEDDEGDSRMPPLLQRRLGSWERLAELSADRAGFLAAGCRLAAAVSAFFKMASGLGPEHLRFDIEAFLAQLEQIQKMQRKDVMAQYSHPVTPVRVRALQLFHEAGAGTATPEARAAADEAVAALAKLMDAEVSEPLPAAARDFLLSAGLLAACAGGAEISNDQYDLLVNLLLPLSADPEAQLARVESAEHAETLLSEAIAWLSQNAGEERYTLFRQLAHMVAVDGVLSPPEEQFMHGIAERLGIPPKAARQALYEIVAGYTKEAAARKPVFAGAAAR